MRLMTGSTRFEREMEKALKANTEAMFRVGLGDMLTHARIVGLRAGLEKALQIFNQDSAAADDKDDV